MLHAVSANLRRLQVLRRELKQSKPDVAIAMVDSVVVLTAIACLGLPFGKVGSERSVPALMPLPGIWRFLRRATYRWVDRVVAQTDAVAYWLKQHTSVRTVTVIPNAVTWPVPLSNPCVDPDCVLPRSRRLLLAAGRFTPEKRFDFLIRAFSRMAVGCPDWDLAILGDGPERTSLETLVEDSGLCGRIFIPGAAGNLHDWYQRADLFCLTSAFEGFPNVLLEAMAYGLPVVTVNCPHGPAAICTQGVDAVLVEADDEVGFEQAITRLAADPNERARLGRNAVRIRDTFAIERVCQLWEDLLVDVHRARGP
jgi:glycosyltransferase involved in cell wall biosynthesis